VTRGVYNRSRQPASLAYCNRLRALWSCGRRFEHLDRLLLGYSVIIARPPDGPSPGALAGIAGGGGNAECPLEETLAQGFPWCADWAGELRRLFEVYVVAKQRDNVLDYDDLLLYWRHAMAEPAVATEIRGCFDHVLVDEYQDTNRLQAEILMALRPDGSGLTIVGDDAQSIYSFRAATVRNILDFPHHFSPPATVIALERNYRSTQPILDAANAVIARAHARIAKTLYSTKASAERPFLANVEDEAAQAKYVADSVLEHREAGIALRRQAVLFRTANHSDLLEIELGRRNIPFVKLSDNDFSGSPQPTPTSSGKKRDRSARR